jgi:hypothetical protein
VSDVGGNFVMLTSKNFLERLGGDARIKYIAVTKVRTLFGRIRSVSSEVMSWEG